MKERAITKRLQEWLRKRDWIVYRPPDTFATSLSCPSCHSQLYCRSCAAFVDNQGSPFTAPKPADLAVLQSPIGWGGWIEVKKAEARTEKGLVYRPKYVKPHQAKALESTDGFLALAFIQKLEPRKEKLVGTYLVRWSLVRDKEVITRAELRELAEITVKDSPEVVPVVIKKVADPVARYLDS
jgi:hypothetical protein